MKVKEAIELLKKQDQEKELVIQQGEIYDYMNVYSIKIIEIVDDEANLKNVVAIEYN